MLKVQFLFKNLNGTIWCGIYILSPYKIALGCVTSNTMFSIEIINNTQKVDYGGDLHLF